ncbi:MAG: hypothetical protein ACE5G9_10275 [Nitrospinales bacterium]
MPRPPDESPPVLFVCLGASNLARGHDALAACLRKNLYPRRVRFLFALGPGRGYCAWGGFLRLVYPPIKNSRIFATAEENTPCRVVALVMDIGNDIMYNIPTEDIIACLEKIFRRLRQLNALILASPIPSYLETDLSQFSFLCLRSLFFPKSRVGYSQAVSGVRRINEFLANAGDVRLLSGLESFAGWDKIHYSLLTGHRAWSAIAAQILQALDVEPRAGIGCRAMAASYAANLTQLITADGLRLRPRGPEYF